MASRIQRHIRTYLQENSTLYLFVSVLFLMGIIFGGIIVNALSMEQKKDLLSYLGTFFYGLDQNTVVEPSVAMNQALGYHLKFVGIMWVLGLSIIGLPLILMFIFLKGVLIGFTVGFLVSQLYWKGILFSLVSVIPQNLIIIPATLILGVTGISFSLMLIRTRFMKRQGGSIWQPFFSYSLVVLVMVGVFFAVSLFEAYISPVLMRSVTPYI